MKRVVTTLVAAVLTVGLLGAGIADAKRLGGGSSSGIRRSVPTQPAPKPAAPNQAQQQQAAPTTPPAAAAAAAPAKRSWMGPIAGLAAGLGLAALASHFGFGAALANAMTMVLIAVAAMMLIGWLMRRRQSPQPGLASSAGTVYRAPAAMPAQQPAAAPLAGNGGAHADGFDSDGFEQIAKRVFIRLQAANDAGDQADLRRFTTPEMYGVIQQELLDRRGAPQQTEVLQLEAQVVDRSVEQGEQIVSVRFRGLVREQSEAVPEDIDEIWHLVRPQDGSRDWAIAGIQQTASLAH